MPFSLPAADRTKHEVDAAGFRERSSECCFPCSGRTTEQDPAVHITPANLSFTPVAQIKSKFVSPAASLTEAMKVRKRWPGGLLGFLLLTSCCNCLLHHRNGDR